jgi:hypothetical protein
MDAGAFIMHRCHGTTTDINLAGNRAVTKMKATITQRFEISGCEVDAESDCRFLFFWVKSDDDWQARFVRHWYEKDKLIPVDPNRVPPLDEARLQSFPSGYRYLAYCQEESMGVQVLKNMPGHNRENGVQDGSREAGKKHNLLYWQAKVWVEGQDIDF